MAHQQAATRASLVTQRIRPHTPAPKIQGRASSTGAPTSDSRGRLRAPILHQPSEGRPRCRPDALMSVFKGCGRTETAAICGCLQIGCAGEEARQIDVGDQALIRVLDTALPNMRPRLSLSYCGRRQCRPQSVRREFLCRRLAPTLAQHMAEVEAAPVTSSERAFRLPTQSRRVLEQSR
jgi:hypothetical protein